MANFESLITADELKWEYLVEATKKPQNFKVRYDDQADMCLIIFTSPDVETAVFYVDSHVGLLVELDSMNVVGFQVEAFKHSFLKNHDELRRVWQVSDTSIQPEDFPDLILRFEKQQQKIAREIIRATEDFIDEPAVEEAVAALA